MGRKASPDLYLRAAHHQQYRMLRCTVVGTRRRSRLRAVQVPPKKCPLTEVLVIDAPAGTTGLLLKDLVRKANYIVIPVAPSPIDIHATADFIKDLYLIGGALTAKVKIAVVANRVRNRNSAVYASLEKFLASLRLPFLTSISDSEVYLQAVGQGVGVFEMDEMLSNTERREIAPILKWLEGSFPNRYGVRAIDNLINLESSKQYAAYRVVRKA